MSNLMTKEIAERYSKFTTDEDLTLDDFIVFEDIDIEHIAMMNRYNTLLNKTFTTDAEKAEMTTLLTQLESYMPTSDTWNKLCACMLNMQMFIREGIVIFIKEKQEEFNGVIANYKYIGDWDEITNYSTGNGVRHNGFGFLSISNNNSGNEPNAELPSDEYWVRYTIKGDKGDPSLNISYKGDYVSTTTYNLGDACTYNSIMYYAKVNGVVGVLPTTQSKWAYVNNVVVSSAQPVDTHVIWWDTTTNKFKRYTSNLKWEEQIINASNLSIKDSGNLFTATNVEEALAELKIAINNINLTASNVAIVDSGNYYTGTNVETVTKEIGSKLSSISSNIGTISSLSTSNKSNLVSAINETFQYANNGKKSIANVVGTVTGSNTHTQIANEVQTSKNILANNLVSKGVSASGSSSLRMLAGLVGNINVNVKKIDAVVTLTTHATTSTYDRDDHFTFTLPNGLTSERIVLLKGGNSVNLNNDSRHVVSFVCSPLAKDYTNNNSTNYIENSIGSGILSFTTNIAPIYSDSVWIEGNVVNFRWYSGSYHPLAEGLTSTFYISIWYI